MKLKKGASAEKKPSGGRHGLVGANLNFAAQEAYKLLRTNLDFALNDVENCRIIGVSSAMRGEGKSLTSVNLTFSLAEAGNRVLLLEADLRLPSLGRKMRLSEKKGLSNALAGQVSDSLPIQEYVVESNERNHISFDVLTAGSTPPNPSELLGSQRMKQLMERLARTYDYIVVDLPPIAPVPDALVMSKLLDGIIVIVRHDYSERGTLAEAMRKLEFSGVHVLGFVFNCAAEHGSGYSRRYRSYRSRYYNSYYRRSSPEKSDSNG